MLQDSILKKFYELNSSALHFTGTKHYKDGQLAFHDLFLILVGRTFKENKFKHTDAVVVVFLHRVDPFDAVRQRRL